MATLATDLSCSTLIRRELHPLGWIKRFHCLIINCPSSELFPTRRRSAPGCALALPGLLDHELKESKGRGLSCPHPLESPSFVPAWADTCWQLIHPESAPENSLLRFLRWLQT